MKEKIDVFTLFVRFFLTTTTQFGKSTKHLPSDNGREYVNRDMFKFISKYDIVNEFMCEYTISK